LHKLGKGNVATERGCMKVRFVLLSALFFSALSAQPAEASLRVGAARVDITPDEKKLPKGFEGINDRIFVRAIVVDDGRTRAALVTVDAGAISTDTWSQVSGQAEKELQIPISHLLLTATHTHSVPFGNNRDLAPRITQAIAQAAERLQPARMAYGTGVSYINVNRNLIDPQTHRWWEGPNYSGLSDKTVAVVRFETLDGRPVAVYYNYGVHAVLTGQLDQISGDIPGAASRYIEDALDDEAVAVWSTGAAGDQNPIYFQQTYDLREIRIKDHAARGIDISNAMPPGGQGLNKRDPKVAKLMSQQRQMAVSMGQMLGEEVLHIMRSNLERPITSAEIGGAQKVVTCPGRKRTDTGRAGYAGSYVDSDPIPIRLSLIKLGDIALGGVNAEIFTAIALRLKRESPLKHTMMVTLSNGMARSGYIPDDAAFGYNTFEVVSSNLKPGCAETAITEGLLDLIATVEN
jgi:neutral ceramidase